MQKHILTNCRAVADNGSAMPGMDIRRVHLALSQGDDPETTGQAAPSSTRTFTSGDTVTFRAFSDDAAFSLCEDRAGLSWWIPTDKLA